MIARKKQQTEKGNCMRCLADQMTECKLKTKIHGSGYDGTFWGGCLSSDIEDRPREIYGDGDATPWCSPRTAVQSYPSCAFRRACNSGGGTGAARCERILIHLKLFKNKCRLSADFNRSFHLINDRYLGRPYGPKYGEFNQARSKALNCLSFIVLGRAVFHDLGREIGAR
jgi:hypothetical protein